MYRESLALFRLLIAWVALYVVVEVVVTVIDTRTATWATLVTSIVNWSLLSYVTCGTLLPGYIEKRSNVLLNFAGFAIRGFGLIFLVLLPTFIITALLSPELTAASFKNSATTGDSPSLFMNAVAWVTTIEGFTVVVFSLLGTCLPASAVRHRQGLAATLRRGRRTFWRTAGLLIAGPVVLGVIYEAGSSLAMFWSTGAFFPFDGTLDILSADGRSNVPVLAAVICTNVVAALSTIMTAWVLCKAFRESTEEFDMASVFS